MKSGEIRTGLLSGEIIQWAGGDYILGVVRDITERRRAEQALRESETQLRLVWESSLDGMRLTDAHGIVRRVNEAYCRLMDQPRGALEGQPMSAPYPEALQAQILEKHRQRFRARNIPPHLERTIVLGNGKQLQVELSNAYLTLPGQTEMVLSVFRDVTERRRAELERIQLERQVQHAQKLESLGVLAGGIAHDFNNLLTAIIGNASLALLDLSPYAPAHQALFEINTAAQRAADLARQMLAYSGRGHFRIQELQLNELVRELGHLLSAAVSKKVHLRYELAGALPPLEGDATQVRQVIMNLITNAAEAIGDQPGVVVIATGTQPSTAADLARHNPAFRPGSDSPLPPGPYVFFQVSDTGSGMDRRTQERMFDPFFTTKFTGRGLGLAAVLGIVRGHRGALKLDSELGKGTTLRVLFPIRQQTPAPAPAPHPSPAPWRGQGLVLVVDDEPAVRALAQRMLERLGFAVLTAADGPSGLEAFRAHAARIVCVLLDKTMPTQDGEAVFAELRRLRAEVPVVLCSGYSEQEATRRFAGLGLAGFLQKPYTHDELAARIQTALQPGAGSPSSSAGPPTPP